MEYLIGIGIGIIFGVILSRHTEEDHWTTEEGNGIDSFYTIEGE